MAINEYDLDRALVRIKDRLDAIESFTEALERDVEKNYTFKDFEISEFARKFESIEKRLVYLEEALSSVHRKNPFAGCGNVIEKNRDRIWDEKTSEAFNKNLRNLLGIKDSSHEESVMKLLVEALKFYADGDNYWGNPIPLDSTLCRKTLKIAQEAHKATKVLIDRGELARATLQSMGDVR